MVAFGDEALAQEHAEVHPKGATRWRESGERAELGPRYFRRMTASQSHEHAALAGAKARRASVERLGRQTWRRWDRDPRRRTIGRRRPNVVLADVRAYLEHLRVSERKSPRSINVYAAAIAFLFGETLGRRAEIIVWDTFVDSDGSWSTFLASWGKGL